jgi:hypothetical protein
MLQAQLLIQQSKDGLKKVSGAGVCRVSPSGSIQRPIFLQVHEGVTSLAADLSKARLVGARLITGQTRAPSSAPIDVPVSSAPANYGAGEGDKYGSF